MADHPSSMDHARRSVTGAHGEDVAAQYLTGRGLRVVARNWRLARGTLRGELDLVCLDGDVLVVVEVKTRRSDRYGGPLAAVTPRKQAKLRALAAAFARAERTSARAIRFDVVGVRMRAGRPPEVTHVAEAF